MGWWIGGTIKHFRMNHDQHEFARGNCPINGIESFWSYAKREACKIQWCSTKNFIIYT